MTGQFYYEDGDYGRAREEFERAAAARPGDPALSYWLGKTYGELGEYQRMRDALDLCLAHGLRYAEEIEKLLQKYWSRQQAEGSSLMEATLPDYPGALVAFRKALIILPGNDKSLHGLAYAYTQVDSAAQAQRIYEELAQSNPADLVAHQALGVFHLRAGRYDEAVGLFERVVALDPYDAVALDRLGTVYEQLGRYTDAVDVCIQLVVQAPDDPMMRVRLGRQYEGLGDAESAAEAYQQALVLNSGDPAALEHLARLRVKEGDDDAALPLLELLTVRTPLERGLWLELARIYRERGLMDHSARALERAGALAPADPDAPGPR